MTNLALPVPDGLNNGPAKVVVAYRWKAVQLAKSKGLSQRAIARELGIARDTVRKYARSAHPPLNRFGEKDPAQAAPEPAGAISRQESQAPVH